MKILNPFLMAGLFAVGCAATGPSERKSAADQSVRAAEELGAPKVPQASLHLQLAKEEIGLAEKLRADGDRNRAEGILTRAQADAELAVALAREAPMQAEAQAEMDKANAMMLKR